MSIHILSGRHRRPTVLDRFAEPLSDVSAWVAARLLDAGAVVGDGLRIVAVVFLASSTLLAVISYFFGGR